ncbi:hypothetical protein [Streptomyces sp. NPDC004546]|uniref:hypothetical protein n=1 Tax=Streptomyces sp. NPDC004546 TaxID=3154282 RepID=UPI0033A4784F
MPIGQAHPRENRPGHLLIRSTESPDGPPLAVLRLRRLWAAPEAITEALHRFAGRRWSTEIRRNNGVVKADANALLLQGRNHTALSAVAVLAAASATAAEFRWMEGSGISSHAVTSLYVLQALSADLTWTSSRTAWTPMD